MAVPAPQTDLQSLIDPGARYLQYKLDPATSDDSVSPIVHDVAVTQTLSGDYDGDGHVGIADFEAFAECLGGPAVMPSPDPPPSGEECLQAFDFNLDQDVDLHDFAAFSIGFTGE
jgi:hypothetical protein